MADTSELPLLRKDEDGLVTLTMNRPDKFNALSEALISAFEDALADIAADPSVRCVVIAGAGRAFCAGHDLAEMRAAPTLDYYRDLFGRCGRMMQAIVNLPVPVIARVQGVATAAGCQLVASCDLAIAAQSARFGVSGINVGLFCSTPAVALTRNVPTKQAFDMLVTGDLINAQAALERGLVSEVVEDEALDAAVARKAQAILAKSPTAIRYGKAMFHTQRRMPLDEAYDFASDVMARNMMEPDTLEGVLAFIEKRPPVRQG